MNDLLNPEIWRGVIASAARWIIPFVFGLIGLELTAEQTGEAVAWLVAGAVFVLSLIWSKKEKVKLLNSPKPPPNQPGSNIKY